MKIFRGKTQNPKKFFGYIDKRTNAHREIPPLYDGINHIDSDLGKAEALSRQYANVFTIDNDEKKLYLIS